MRVHMYKVKHIHAEMIFTHTADMFAEIVSGNVIESLAAQILSSFGQSSLTYVDSLARAVPVGEGHHDVESGEGEHEVEETPAVVHPVVLIVPRPWTFLTLRH